MMDIIQDYFIAPILDKSLPGYNLVNTLVYAAILIALSFFVIYPFLDRRGVKFNGRLLLAVLPYIFLGSTFRVIEDMGLIQRSANPLEIGFYTFTPGIYIAVGLLTIVSLFLALYFSKKLGKSFYKAFFFIGLVPAVPVVVFNFLNFKVWDGFLFAIAFTTLAFFVCRFVLNNFLKNPLLDNLSNRLAFLGQSLDGCATFVAIGMYNCGEQHVASAALIDNLGPLAFPLAKVLLILLIIHYVDKDIKRENLRGFVKLFIIVLGFAPGIRDLFTIGVGTCL